MISDADLAKLHGVTTKRLNEQVKRNHDRFPEDFMFQLTRKEKDDQIEKILLVHDTELKDLIEKIRPLLLPPPEKPRKKIYPVKRMSQPSTRLQYYEAGASL